MAAAALREAFVFENPELHGPEQGNSLVDIFGDVALKTVEVGFVFRARFTEDVAFHRAVNRGHIDHVAGIGNQTRTLFLGGAVVVFDEVEDVFHLHLFELADAHFQTRGDLFKRHDHPVVAGAAARVGVRDLRQFVRVHIAAVVAHHALGAGDDAVTFLALIHHRHVLHVSIAARRVALEVGGGIKALRRQRAGRGEGGGAFWGRGNLQSHKFRAERDVAGFDLFGEAVFERVERGVCFPPQPLGFHGVGRIFSAVGKFYFRHLRDRRHGIPHERVEALFRQLARVAACVDICGERGEFFAIETHDGLHDGQTE